MTISGDPPSLVRRLRAVALESLVDAHSLRSHPTDPGRHAPPFAFLDHLAWSMLLDFVVGLAAGLVSGAMIQRLARRPNREAGEIDAESVLASIRQELEDLEGRMKVHDEKRREIVLEIERTLARERWEEGSLKTVAEDAFSRMFKELERIGVGSSSRR